MTHTPTPWKVASNKMHVLDNEGLIIVYPGGSRTEATAKNNAQFIVQACNAHEELVKVLQGVLHHNNAVKEQYQLPNSLISQIEQALNTIEKGA